MGLQALAAQRAAAANIESAWIDSRKLQAEALHLQQAEAKRADIAGKQVAELEASIQLHKAAELKAITEMSQFQKEAEQSNSLCEQSKSTAQQATTALEEVQNNLTTAEATIIQLQKQLTEEKESNTTRSALSVQDADKLSQDLATATEKLKELPVLSKQICELTEQMANLHKEAEQSSSTTERSKVVAQQASASFKCTQCWGVT